jgi:hypothetical protein
MMTSYRDFNASSGRDSRAMVNVSPWCGDRIIRFGGAAHPLLSCWRKHRYRAATDAERICGFDMLTTEA